MLRLAIAAAALFLIAATALQAEPAHGIALYGTPKEPPGFTHFPYVDPDAPKGGRLTIGAYGSFDSLNPLIVQAAWPPTASATSSSRA